MVLWVHCFLECPPTHVVPACGVVYGKGRLALLRGTIDVQRYIMWCSAAELLRDERDSRN